MASAQDGSRPCPTVAGFGELERRPRYCLLLLWCSGVEFWRLEMNVGVVLWCSRVEFRRLEMNVGVVPS